MTCPPPFWPCNKVLKPNFQFIISHTYNGCSLLLLILTKLLLLDISCENIFALSIVAALTAYPFSTRQCAKMSVFYVKTVKFIDSWGLRTHIPLASGGWGFQTRTPGSAPPPPLLLNLGSAIARRFLIFN